jgi:hypothetical protein
MAFLRVTVTRAQMQRLLQTVPLPPPHHPSPAAVAFLTRPSARATVTGAQIQRLQAVSLQALPPRHQSLVVVKRPICVTVI